MARTIHLTSPVLGFGNRLDLEIAGALLEQKGFDVTRFPVVERGKVGRFKPLLRRILQFRGRFDANVFMAPLFPEWFPMARKNVIIPNVEGFWGHQLKWLPRIDLVLAKTRLTERVFRDLGRRVEYIGFESRDHLDATVPRDYTRFFHACSSQFKGTQRLLEVWKRHPEWPELVAVINNDTVSTDLTAPNIRAIRRRLPHQEFVRLQNSIGFHICCSEAEGFGHYIMEAMSCRAVVLTTNAPPMNELVQPSRGVLVDPLDNPPAQGLSHRYLFKPESLEEQIERVMKFDRPTIDSLGDSARAYFLETNRFFRERFVEVMRSL